MKQRKREIRKISKDAFYKTREDRKAAMESFHKSALSIDEIERLVQPLKKEYYEDFKPKTEDKPTDLMGGVF